MHRNTRKFYKLFQLSLRSLDPSFGLLFHDLFLELDIDSMKASLIMSILDAIVNFSGIVKKIINLTNNIYIYIDSFGIILILIYFITDLGLLVGPLLKKYSYRQVSFFGSLLSCSGLILTSRSNSMIHIVCTYSILGGRWVISNFGTNFLRATVLTFVHTG